MLRRGLRAGVLAAIAVAPLSARAELAGVVAANVVEGATSNALNAPDGSPGNGSDEFTTLRASLIGSYRSRQQDQTLSYIYAANFLADHSEGDSQSHELNWVLNAIPSGRTEIHAEALGAYSVLNSVNPIAAAAALDPQVVAAGQLMATPTGAVTFVNTGAIASGSFRPKASILWRETSTFEDFIPVHGDIAHTFELAQDFRHEHQWARDAFTLDLSGGYLQAFGFTASTGLVLPPIETLQGQLLAGWRRDLAPELFVSLEAGVLVIGSLVTDIVSVGPAGKGVAHYQRGLAFADLTIAHAPEPNLYIGQTLVSDSATLRALLPLDKKERFRLVALGQAERSSVLSSGGLAAAVDLLAVEAGVLYQPIGYPFLASLDYVAQDQIGYDAAGTVYPSLHRQMVMLTLTATWGSNAFWGGGATRIGGAAGVGSPAGIDSSVEPGSLGGPTGLVGSGGVH